MGLVGLGVGLGWGCRAREGECSVEGELVENEEPFDGAAAVFVAHSAVVAE
ncbi:hypothetical protein [Microbacterium panaciterrae]|uniref:hypothetical protein n=1 Tax=Microbacterium panaciterrae TaxID=985759 RepID=UPI0031E8F3DD